MYENSSHVRNKMARNTQTVFAEEEPRYVSHPVAHTSGRPISESGEEEPRYVSHPVAHTSGRPISESGEEEPRYVSHPVAHTSGISASGEEEPRYVSHPVAHTNAVFWHNIRSNTENIDLATQASVNAHVSANNGVNCRHIIDALRSR
jgi:hypothetical protein